jgi:hypothetical protein
MNERRLPVILGITYIISTRQDRHKTRQVRLISSSPFYLPHLTSLRSVRRTCSTHLNVPSHYSFIFATTYCTYRSRHRTNFMPLAESNNNNASRPERVVLRSDYLWATQLPTPRNNKSGSAPPVGNTTSATARCAFRVAIPGQRVCSTFVPRHISR